MRNQTCGITISQHGEVATRTPYPSLREHRTYTFWNCPSSLFMDSVYEITINLETKLIRHNRGEWAICEWRPIHRAWTIDYPLDSICTLSATSSLAAPFGFANWFFFIHKLTSWMVLIELLFIMLSSRWIWALQWYWKYISLCKGKFKIKLDSKETMLIFFPFYYL